MRNPPILVSVLGFFGAMAGFAWLFLGLRLIGFDWFGIFGDLPQLEHVGIWGWLAILAGILWLAAAVGLWALQPWAWAFAMVIAGISAFRSGDPDVPVLRQRHRLRRRPAPARADPVPELAMPLRPHSG